jgi:hypothetical protein
MRLSFFTPSHFFLKGKEKPPMWEKEGTSVKQQHLKGLESNILSESAKNLQFML